MYLREVQVGYARREAVFEPYGCVINLRVEVDVLQIVQERNAQVQHLAVRPSAPVPVL